MICKNVAISEPGIGKISYVSGVMYPNATYRWVIESVLINETSRWLPVKYSESNKPLTVEQDMRLTSSLERRPSREVSALKLIASHVSNKEAYPITRFVTLPLLSAVAGGWSQLLWHPVEQNSWYNHNQKETQIKYTWTYRCYTTITILIATNIERARSSSDLGPATALCFCITIWDTWGNIAVCCIKSTLQTLVKWYICWNGFKQIH